MKKCKMCGIELAEDNTEEICGDCHQSLCAEQPYQTVIVTHEMAIDGGCPEMEGMEIPWS